MGFYYLTYIIIQLTIFFSLSLYSIPPSSTQPPAFVISHEVHHLQHDLWHSKQDQLHHSYQKLCQERIIHIGNSKNHDANKWLESVPLLLLPFWLSKKVYTTIYDLKTCMKKAKSTWVAPEGKAIKVTSFIYSSMYKCWLSNISSPPRSKVAQ